MKCRTTLQLLLAAMTLLGMPAMAAAATPPAATADTATAANVTVTYDQPEKFTETRKLRSLAPTRLDDGYLKTLKTYIETRAGKMLPPGDRLDIVVTDIDRAGSFEPWRRGTMQEVRIIKDIYPPRIDLHFRLLDASGKVIREGERKLRDPGFMSSGGATSSNDSLRYEKALLDRWLRKGPDQL
ncbi:DUF3016 domain-containing protein [Rhodanobacter sp. PCA2]|uniref:DUF3016 domain-containing protein n=1 Tax=Rhodanobacter sp. PCA2 TaxID=2006117 RepID=UPI0015E76706|nr:DUF3016 domain-containing protein [Rhodanobacter sp. PCA2]MBA2079701.1 hypothetical protein [Rhodanobacter sp. PCA2]